ncbi:MAG TPA: endonuclease IV [Ruminiclostridium sp.]|jgi:deoxyribonuclease-4|nr:TIM barrel protein [Clostridiaceae bacterium]HAA26095.1 endonuclease IV [Ruminiclostridium sp.]
MPRWLKKMGLNAYEYQCNKGTNIKKETAEKIGEEAKKAGIRMSIHAPYYINLASTEEEKRENSIKYILKTLQIAEWMGAGRIVVHPGTVGKMSREKAMSLALPTLAQALTEADLSGFADISICPEVLGRISQLGDLDEIILMCGLDESMIPCVDFGHVYARSLGRLKTIDDYRHIFNTLENSLGKDRTNKIHIHFSRIEFTDAGERRHHTIEDTEYGPDFEPLAKVLAERKAEPVIICESRDRMAEDALILKQIYEAQKPL